MIAGGILLLLGLWQLFDPLDPQSANLRDRAILVALGWVHAIAGDVGLAMVLLTCALLLIGLGASRWRRGTRASI